MRYIPICAVAALLSVSPANAQQRLCGPLKGVLKHLEENFKEFPIFVATKGPVSLTVTRADDGSWSLVDSNGTMACVIASGKTSEIDRGV